MKRCWVLLLPFALITLQCEAGSRASLLTSFAVKFWSWRSLNAPITSDDLPRTALIRPDGWAASVSTQSFARQEEEYEVFVAELKKIRNFSSFPFEKWDAATQADYWALTSALNRVYWELHIFLPMWRDPGYYFQQSYGAVWDTLVTTRRGWNEKHVQSALLPRLQALTTIMYSLLPPVILNSTLNPTLIPHLLGYPFNFPSRGEEPPQRDPYSGPS